MPLFGLFGSFQRRGPLSFSLHRPARAPLTLSPGPALIFPHSRSWSRPIPALTGMRRPSPWQPPRSGASRGWPGGCLRSGAGAAPRGIALAGIAPGKRGTRGTGRAARGRRNAVINSVLLNQAALRRPLGSWRRVSRQAARRGSLSPPSCGAGGEAEWGRGPGSGSGAGAPAVGAAGGRGAPGARWMARSGAGTRRDGADARRMVPVADWGPQLERG